MKIDEKYEAFCLFVSLQFDKKKSISNPTFSAQHGNERKAANT